MEEYVVDEWEHAGCTIKIIADQDVQDPRKDYDHSTGMLCLHGRYNLGDEDLDITQGELDDAGCGSWTDVGRYLEARHGVILKLPLHLYDHSSLAMRTGSFREDPGGWDSGLVGFIFYTEKALRDQFCIPEEQPITDENRKFAIKCMEAEVKEYSAYLEGDCVGFVVEDADGGLVDSCWGYLDYYAQKDHIQSEANWHAEAEQKRRIEANGAKLMQHSIMEVMA